MNKPLLYLTTLAVLGVAALDAQAARVGDPAPNFRLDRLDGGQATLSDFEGQVVLIFFLGYS